MSRFGIDRRTVLRGMIGGAAVAVGLPPLEAMFNANGDAYSDDSKIPIRFVTFFFGNGVLWDRWIPTEQGPNYQLTDQLQPLLPVKEYCAVMTGFENRVQPQITHHEGVAGMFSGYPLDWDGGLYSGFSGPSIDQVVADAVGRRTTLFRSIELGVSKRVSTDEGPTMSFIAHRGKDAPMPPIYSPRELFTRLFGSFTPPEDPSGPLRISLLDAVSDDLAALRARVSRADKARLDAHTESVAVLQEQIAALPPACELPSQPSATNEDVDGVEPMPEVARAMADLIVHAFRCDLTRVASYMLTGGVGHAVYSHLGHTTEQHFMSHAPVTYADELNATIVWNMEQFAYLLTRLRDTEEGAHNILHNSVVVMGSDCGEGWSHATYDQPVVIAGRAGGRLTTGFHYRSPNNENLSDVLLAAVKAAAPKVTEIGDEDGYSNRPHPALLPG